jgi:arsenite methyltransferase
MGDTLQFDDAMSRRIVATYTTPDIVEQRQAILRALDLRPGEKILDVGSGPGLLAHDMAAAVGESGSVTGIDPSRDMLAIAAARVPPIGSAEISFGPGEATALPFPAASFNVVTATQVYEYVADVPTALSETHRVLRPGGRVLILDTDWDSIVWRSNDTVRMQRVLDAWDAHLIDPHLPRRLRGLLEDAGFTVTHRAAIPLLNTGYDPNTFSAGLIGFITSYVPGHAGVTDMEATAWADNLVDLGSDYFFSVNRYLFLAIK